MRIKINFSKNTVDVPFENQSIVNSYIHKCLGANNKYHDAKNDYCISHLYGGKMNENNKLSFENGGYILISSHNAEFINKLLIGIITNPIFAYGMSFSGVEHINENFTDGWNHFATLSPFIIKKQISREKYEFVTLEDDDFENEVKKYLINKLQKINDTLDLSDFDVKIPEHESHKVKNIFIKKKKGSKDICVKNRANQCQISIYSNKKVIDLLYNIGIGQSTGSGFGTIYKTENHGMYRTENKKPVQQLEFA